METELVVLVLLTIGVTVRPVTLISALVVLRDSKDLNGSLVTLVTALRKDSVMQMRERSKAIGIYCLLWVLEWNGVITPAYSRVNHLL